MNANSYLVSLSESAIARDLTKLNIDRSLESLRTKIDSHFSGTILTGKTLKEHFAFGSYTRGTMLPRNMDSQSDIDYMVVFNDSDAKPQTYLDRLRRFVEEKYPKSEIFQSSPTIVLELNHIKFELVPAIKTLWDGLQIPNRSGNRQGWMATEPNEFNERLTEKNKRNDNHIKPLIRVLKYWNARNGYPFESFQLEQKVVDHISFSGLLLRTNLWNRFADFVEDMDSSWNDPDYKKEAIARATELVKEVKHHISRGDEDQAQRKLQRLLPPI